MDSDPRLRMIYFLMAAFAGAVTALAFMKWQEMHWFERALTVFVGFSFAVFATPWLAHIVFGTSENDGHAIGFLAYLSASGSNILLPMAIRWLGRMFGQEKRDA
jgi:hypothetical protein